MNKQEILNKIEKIEKELARIKQELNKTEEEWIPEDNEEYWYYDKDEEELNTQYWNDTYIDKRRLKNKVIFKTEEEAQRYADYQKAKEEYSYEFSKEEWEDTELRKYYIVLDKRNNEEQLLDVDWLVYRQSIGQIFFKTKKQAQEFIDKYKAEILEFEFGIKE